MMAFQPWFERFFLMSQHANSEQRRYQRFRALKDDKPCIDVCIGQMRVHVLDLSLDGFSIASDDVAPEQEIEFVMRLIDGFGDKIRGRARCMNAGSMLNPPTYGFQFTELSADDARTLQEWLTVIVICAASVRLSAREAEAIVKGPSLI